MKPLVRFKTKYGVKVTGGRYGDTIWSPGYQEDLEAPLVEMDPEIVKKSEDDHLEALKKHRMSWNLD